MKAVDICGKKLQAVKAEFFRGLRAEADHVLFAVDTGHFHRAAHDGMQIVVCRKAKIAFPATEIEHMKFSCLRQRFIDICDLFHKTMDLTEFCVLLVINSPGCVGNAERTQKRLVSAQQILLFPVMRQRAALGLRKR